jgi:hypothetical protein
VTILFPTAALHARERRADPVPLLRSLWATDRAARIGVIVRRDVAGRNRKQRRLGAHVNAIQSAGSTAAFAPRR